MRTRVRAVLLALIALTGVHAARADGGRLRFRQPAGPFIVTLFTTPDPLTVGPADFSVAVERAGQPGLVEDADVTLVLTSSAHNQPIVLHATHAGATSKWLQAANFRIPARGVWRVTVVVRRGKEAGQCSASAYIGRAATRDLIWDVLPVPLVALFLLVHFRRKRRYNRERLSRIATSIS